MACGGETLTAEAFSFVNEQQRDEVELLQSIFPEEGRVVVEHEEGETAFSLLLTVPVRVDKPPITIDTWVPYNNDIDLELHGVPECSKPSFQRSDSGSRWHSSFDVNHLTPFTLHVTLPENYPDEVPPIFTLSCLWLDSYHLKQLCEHLDQLWNENIGIPILYLWIDWLEDNALRCLEIKDKIQIMPVDITEERPDPRVIPEFTDLQIDLATMLRYHLQRELEDFYQSKQTCGICFDEFDGTEFFYINECMHHFCKACLTDYCHMHVKDGTVLQLNCPDIDCKIALPPYIMNAVLGPKAFERWEKLLLERTLERMEDIDWCPRCNHVVICEEGLARCANCFLTFCVQCKETYHQGTPCKSAADKLSELEKESKKKTNKAKKDEIRQLIERYTNELLIKRTAKKCPKCGIPIEKISGCNKVTCAMCGSFMCWVCGRQIKGYDHFSSSGCATFVQEGPQAPRRIVVAPEFYRAQAELERNGRKNVIACVRCRQYNVKQGSNNHIRCWACSCHLCFSCKNKIDGKVTDHFVNVSGCKQHST
ncbi:E3 ubiquitin-protein ligase RNF14-like [Tubulanus polymorphus]|uniref:E3 ubiquitin-protein ligase RNF14-like n=1 Tax=Tubulanus polymorphus TaxID=672921 RepID=UPI003DA58B44